MKKILKKTHIPTQYTDIPVNKLIFKSVLQMSTPFYVSFKEENCKCIICYQGESKNHQFIVRVKSSKVKHGMLIVNIMFFFSFLQRRRLKSHFKLIKYNLKQKVFATY